MSDKPTAARPLHLQTIESLFAELIGGAAISVGDAGETFSLASLESRAILNWYRVNRAKWSGNVLAPDVEAVVDALSAKLPTLPVPAVAGSGKKHQLRLIKLVVHRFAGIHNYGTPTEPPEDFVFEPKQNITLFEGCNGAGKTSLVNAAVWCLTGDILRPQRPPESGLEEFDGHFLHGTGDDSQSQAHGLTPITPLPNPTLFKPETGKPVPIDSWVEMTFVNEDGAVLPPIRRTQSRTARGKPSEITSGFDTLGIEPIAFRTGTTMPGILPFLKVGAASELGTAAAKLTGLADVTSLAKHAGKVREKLKADFKKAREEKIVEADGHYADAMTDLKARIKAYPQMAPVDPIPAPSAANDVEAKLQALEQHFIDLKAKALAQAQTILGTGFDPNDEAARDALEGGIAPAQVHLTQLGQLASARRLQGLTDISPDQWKAVDGLLSEIRIQADTLAELAKTPELGRRKQLYARVAGWHAEGDGKGHENCALCVRPLKGITDPVTGKAISEHLAEVSPEEQALLALTQQTWAKNWTQRLTADCPLALSQELTRDLPTAPTDLIRSIFVEELFKADAFSGTFASLKTGVAKLCDKELDLLPAFVEPAEEEFPAEVAANAGSLQKALSRIARARAFADWRTGNASEGDTALKAILRGPADATEKIEETTPIGRKLDALASIVKGVEPLNTALNLCGRMRAQLNIRRTNERRLADYAKAVTALAPVINLGSLAEAQVETLRKALHDRAVFWRDKCYGNSYVEAGHKLHETAMDAKGVLEILVGTGAANAPAQHISNASALRASLMGFYLAFWEHVLKESGGLSLLILDDPQELLDTDNMMKLAKLLPDLTAQGAQLMVTTYDKHFAREVVAVGRTYSSVAHLSVHPVNPSRNIIDVSEAIDDLDRRRDAYLTDKENAALAQDYAGQVRIFLEARLADMFDDPAYPAYGFPIKKPTFGDYLNRIRGLAGAPPNALFKGKAVTDFCRTPALIAGHACYQVLNTAHHDKAKLSAGDIYAVKDDMDRVVRLAEKMHMDFRMWRWHQPIEPVLASNVVPFKPVSVAPFSTLVHPDLAAFTEHASHEASQDAGHETLNQDWFKGKSLFYVRADNLGFSLPSGCIAIVESEPYEGKDHNLVIARHGENILARRLFRPKNGDFLSLAAEAPDPRQSRPTLVVKPDTVALHRIVGMLTERPKPPYGSGEATEIASASSLSQIKIAYRVKEESGVPLALPGQIVLGGDNVLPDQLSATEEELVALTLKGGSSVFKRVGKPVPGTAKRLWQFESIGGLGSSLIVSLDPADKKDAVPIFGSARRVIGILYYD
jgi:hypothetical protein